MTIIIDTGKYLLAVGVLAISVAGQAWAGACDNSEFRDFFSKVQHAGAGNPNYTRLDKTPDDYTGFKTDCYNNPTTGGCLDYYGKRFKLIATSGVTTKWSAAVCGRVRQADRHHDYEHRIFLQGQQPFFGAPKVSFQFQDDNGRWRILRGTSSGRLASFEFGQSGRQWFRWKWFSDRPRRFRMVVERAMRHDEFDFMMDW